MPLSNERLLELSAENDVWRFERDADGRLEITAAASNECDEASLEIAAQIRNWGRAGAGGMVHGSSGGFDLPSSANRSPDAAWLSSARLAALTAEQPAQAFKPLAPDLRRQGPLAKRPVTSPATQDARVDYGWNVTRMARRPLAWRSAGLPRRWFSDDPRAARDPLGRSDLPGPRDLVRVRLEPAVPSPTRARSRRLAATRCQRRLHPRLRSDHHRCVRGHGRGRDRRPYRSVAARTPSAPAT